MSRYIKVFAALVISGSSVAMIAASPPADSNGDGVITRADVAVVTNAPQVSRPVSNKPVNERILISNKPLQVTQGETTQPDLELPRKPQNIQIDPDLTEMQSRQLDGVDKNGDGYVSQDEVKSLREEFLATGGARLGSSLGRTEGLSTRERLQTRVRQQRSSEP